MKTTNLIILSLASAFLACATAPDCRQQAMVSVQKELNERTKDTPVKATVIDCQEIKEVDFYFCSVRIEIEGGESRVIVLPGQAENCPVKK